MSVAEDRPSELAAGRMPQRPEGAAVRDDQDVAVRMCLGDSPDGGQDPFRERLPCLPDRDALVAEATQLVGIPLLDLRHRQARPLAHVAFA